ncbi:restriction endonuclease subunit S [Luteolibacter marinus]|uniref:restriction endonuclease subunit S n=1 Tax=Luteolibacter marinus TaxID=2776705 RepID=UPI001866229B|nr:restriction endonuclease subunit S [Luteolibacter marinus]
MSFPRYSKYKDSGVEWLGEVPEHWEKRSLQSVASTEDSIFIDGDWIESKDISDLGVRYLTSGNVGAGFYKEQGQGFITAATFEALNCTEVLPGDILISRLNLPIGRACIVPDLESRIVTCVDNVIFRPGPLFDRRFIVYLLSSKHHFANTDNLGRGSTMQRISRSILGKIRFAFPPLPEQTAIAAFLDRETAKIDGLVAEQRRLMELLKEKRQAVISHAVTKGLNPDAPMKPSGIEWLGNVPEHWEVVQSRRLFRVRNEPARESDQQLTASQKYGMLPQSEFMEREGRKVVLIIEGKDSLRHAEPNDFIISLRSFQGGIEWCTLAGSVTFHYVVLMPIKHVHPPFFAHLFKSTAYIQALRSTANLIRDGQDLRFSHFVQVDLPIVPLDEQAAIADFLNQELAKLDTLTAEAQRAIDLLQERRTALISAAVTGQIDVRHISAPQNPCDTDTK